MVVNALSRRAVTKLRAMFARLSLFDDGSPLAELQVESDDNVDFGLNSEGVLCFRRRICVLKDTDLRQSILREAYSSPYTIHSGGNKMDPRFTSQFWKELHEGLGKRLDFSTAFDPQTDGQSERVIQILEDMLRSCSSIQMAPYEALYDRRCRTPSCWNKLGEQRVQGPELVFDTEEKVRLIWDWLKVASDRQKSYVDLKHREIEYFVGDFVFLKLPPELDQIHDLFHVSMLRHYRSDPTHVVPVEEIDVRPDLTFEEEPV
ncbi:uncharacterized protein [Gossypium hirsutum]|uniref:Uncharacterized protein n=1 Tax=Gossypium hirsutum TaxID=3635 RepID=A0A1U8PGM0_GOSHI|nr:uncharacterized protein LOC107958947 [Gossypium hirsutum]